MIPTADWLTAAITADPCELHARGWSEEALPVRQRVLKTLHGWGTAEPSKSPTPAELMPLVAVWQSDTPAADEAELMLMMLELGQALPPNQGHHPPGD